MWGPSGGWRPGLVKMRTPFVSHLVQVVGLRRIDVALSWEDPIPADINADRKVLAKRLEEAVRHSVSETTAKEGLLFGTPQDLDSGSSDETLQIRPAAERL